MRAPRTESAKRVLFLVGVAALVFVLSIAAQCFLFQYAFGGHSRGIFHWLTITPTKTFVSFGGWAVWVAAGIGVFASARATIHRQWRLTMRWAVIAVCFGLAAAFVLVSIDLFVAPRVYLDELVEPFLPAIAATVQLIGSWLQIRRGAFCAECGYDLQGNESGVCPECGTAIPHARRS